MPVFVEREAPRVVRRGAQELQLGDLQRTVTGRVGVAGFHLEAVVALLEVQPLPVDGAVEPGVPDAAVVPVVEAVPQVARPGVGVVGRPAGHQDLLHIRLAVAVGVLQKQRVRGLVDNYATVSADDARRDAELVREHGELVGLAVAVGVFEDHDLVAAFARLLHFVRVIGRHRDPQPPAFIPGHRHRLATLEVGVRCEQLHLEVFGRGVVLDRFLWRQRLLHRRNRLRNHAPGFAGRVERHFRGDVLEVFLVAGDRCHFRCVNVDRAEVLLAARPPGAAFHERVETLVAPGALVVSPSRVEDAAFAVGSHPGPRFLHVPFDAVF